MQYSHRLLSAVAIVAVAAFCLSAAPAFAQGGAAQGTLTAPNGSTPVSDLWVSIHNANWSVSQGTYTDSAGAFSFTELAAGTYELLITSGSADYAAPDPESFEVVRGQTTNLGVVTLKTPNVTGRLRLPDGSAGVSNTYINLRSGDWLISKSAQTGSDGSFVFYVPAGTYYLELWNTAYVDGTYYWPPATQTVVVSAGATVALGDLEYQAANVTGMFTEPDGSTPVTSGSINFHTSDWSFSRSVNPGMDGSFAVYMPAGTYTVDAAAYDNPYPNPESFTITVAGSALDVGIVELQSPNIIGKITEADGDTPVTGVSVSLHNDNWSVSKSTNTSAEGTFNFYVGAGTYTIEFSYWNTTASAPAALTVTVVDPDTITYYDGTNGSSVLTLRAPAMRGKIVRPDGSAAVSASVYVHDVSYSYENTRSATTDFEGIFKIDAVATGTYVLEVTPPWDNTGNALIAPDAISVALTAGTTNTTYLDSPIALSTAQKTISGVVEDASGNPVTDANVSAWRRNGSGWAQATTNSSGAYSLTVGQGKWELSVYPQQWPQQWGYFGGTQSANFAASNAVVEAQTVDFAVTDFDATLQGYIEYPDGSVPPVEDFVSVSAWSQSGGGNWSNVDTAGFFSMKLPAGTFDASIYSNDNTYGAPDIAAVTLTAGETVDVGTLRFVEKNEFINGMITDSNGQALANQWVNAWKVRGMGWASTQTDSDGNYSLNVTPGTWMVDSWPSDGGGGSGAVATAAATGGAAAAGQGSSGTTYVRTDEPQRVVVQTNETKQNINFQFAIADATISGTVQTADGTVITDMSGWAFANKTSQSRSEGMWFSGLGGSVEQGAFTIQVPAGTWQLGMQTWWGSDYSTSGETTVTIASGETVDDVVITLLPNDASISGTLVDENGELADVWGSVFAENDAGGYAWSDITNGSYSLDVAAGTWRIGYWVDWSSGYLDWPLDDNRVTVAAEEDKVFDIALRKANATLAGTVTDPDGNPLPNAWISVDTKLGGQVADANACYSCWSNRGQLTDANGNYSIKVPAGSYFVTASLPPDFGYVNPQAQRVSVAADATTSVDLQFKLADSTIAGTVTLADVASPAFVWAYSEGGGYAEASTDDGTYTLPVTSGDTWHVGAIYETTTVFYRSAEQVIEFSAAGAVTQDLILVAGTGTLPAPMSVTFSAAASQTLTLDDGTKISIPAYAITTDDVDITVSATPKAQIPNQAHAKPISIGYELEARYASGAQTGQEITAFNSDITLTLQYTDEQLAALGITEADLQPMYYDETAGAWKSVENVVVDTENNQITFTVQHFSAFAIVTGASASVAPVLTITTPQDNDVITVNSLLVSGTVSDATATLTIAINGETQATPSADNTGAFSATVDSLVTGNNTVAITAVNGAGSAEKTRTVVYQPATSGNGGGNNSGDSGDNSGDLQQDETDDATPTTVPTGEERELVVSAVTGGPQVRVFDKDGNLLHSFFAYDERLRGSFQVATVDLDGDGNREIVTAPGAGFGPLVRIFDRDGNALTQFFAYDANYRGGVSVQFADVDGDNHAEIIVTPLSAGGPNVRVYRYTATPSFELVGWFMAYDENFRGQLNVATADFDRDGAVEIIVAPRTGSANVRVYRYVDGAFALVDWFMAYDESYRGGVNVVTADTDGDAVPEIVVAPASKGGPNVRVYNYNAATTSFTLQDWWLTYDDNYRGGVNLTVTDVDADGAADIITTPATGGVNVRVYHYVAASTSYELLDWFMPYGDTYRGGVKVTAANVDADAYPEIVVAPERGGANVRLYEYVPASAQIELYDWFMAYEETYRGGINLTVTDVEGDGNSDLVIAPAGRGGPNLRVYHYQDENEKVVLSHWFWGFASTFRGGAKVAIGS